MDGDVGNVGLDRLDGWAPRLILASTIVWSSQMDSTKNSLKPRSCTTRLGGGAGLTVENRSWWVIQGVF